MKNVGCYRFGQSCSTAAALLRDALLCEGGGRPEVPNTAATFIVTRREILPKQRRAKERQIIKKNQAPGSPIRDFTLTYTYRSNIRLHSVAFSQSILINHCKSLKRPTLYVVQTFRFVQCLCSWNASVNILVECRCWLPVESAGSAIRCQEKSAFWRWPLASQWKSGPRYERMTKSVIAASTAGVK